MRWRYSACARTSGPRDRACRRSVALSRVTDERMLTAIRHCGQVPELVGHDCGARAVAIACGLRNGAAFHLVMLSVGFGTNDSLQPLTYTQAREYQSDASWTYGFRDESVDAASRQITLPICRSSPASLLPTSNALVVRASHCSLSCFSAYRNPARQAVVFALCEAFAASDVGLLRGQGSVRPDLVFMLFWLPS